MAVPSDMLCAVWRGTGDLRLERQPVEAPRGDEVLVRVAACGVCATDLHLLDGSIALYPPPRILGHETAGVVAAVGPAVRSLRPDDRVALDTSIPCDRCFYCQEGLPFLCGERTSRSGGFAEYLAVPERIAYRLPDGVSLEVGALAEPLSCCLHAVGMAPLRPGATAAVVGAGPIGLLLVQLLRHLGVVACVVSEPDPARRALARELGATHVVDPRSEDARTVTLAATDGVGVDAVFEAVGASATIEAALALPRRGGAVVIVGVAPVDATVTLRPWDLFMRELTIRASTMRASEFGRAVRLLPALRLEPLVRERVPLSEVHRAFQLARERRAPKVLVCP